MGQRWGPDRRLWQVPMKEMPGPQLVRLASASSLHCIGFDRFIGDLCVAKPHMILSAGLSLPECPLCAQHHGSFRLTSLPAPPAPTTHTHNLSRQRNPRSQTQPPRTQMTLNLFHPQSKYLCLLHRGHPTWLFLVSLKASCPGRTCLDPAPSTPSQVLESALTPPALSPIT